MKNRLSKPLFVLAALAAVGAGAGASAIVSAQTAVPKASFAQHMDKRGPGIVGTVSSVNGTTISVTGKDNTIYTVDASASKIFKSSVDATTQKVVPAEITATDVGVGDTLHVRGTISGSSIKATIITIGQMPFSQKGGHMMGAKGKVSSVNGTSITFTLNDGSSAKVGDYVRVIPHK